MKILIAGDFCPINRLTPIIEKGDFVKIFGSVRDIISKVDYSILNFECPVIEGRGKPIVKQGPNLHCSSKGVEAIKWAGFNCVTLANNHFYDFGDDGVKNTLETCKGSGIDTVGGGLNLKKASNILFKQLGDKTLAVINCCEHEFSIASDTHGGSNPLNPIQQYYSIKEAKEKADFVLVIVHGGHEHWQLPSPRMQETYRFFIDVGADAVVNHHQHCYSGYEVYNEKPIFYGLGNLCFDLPSKHGGIWTEGYMVSIDFKAHASVFEIHPYRQCDKEPGIELIPQTAYKKRIEKLNSIISNSKELWALTEQYYSSCKDQYSNILEPIRNRFYLGAKRRGWLPTLVTKDRKLLAKNFICCESHRDKMTYYLE